MSLSEAMKRASAREAEPATNENGSAQRIVLRDIGDVVDVMIAGMPFQLRPGSLGFHNVLTRFQEHGKRVLSEQQKEQESAISQEDYRVFSEWKEIIDQAKMLDTEIEAIIAQRQAQQDESLEAERFIELRKARVAIEMKLFTRDDYPQAQRFIEATREIKERIIISTNEHCLRVVQLLLLNSKNPKWYQEKERLTSNGFPNTDFLDSVITLDTLYHDASISELDNVSLVFEQFKKPEIFRKNAMALMGIQSNLHGRES